MLPLILIYCVFSIHKASRWIVSQQKRGQNSFNTKKKYFCTEIEIFSDCSWMNELKCLLETVFREISQVDEERIFAHVLCTQGGGVGPAAVDGLAEVQGRPLKVISR